MTSPLFRLNIAIIISMHEEGAIADCMQSCLAFLQLLCTHRSQRGSFSAFSVQGSDSWVEVDTMDLSSEDEQSRQEHMREHFQAMDLSSRSDPTIVRQGLSCTKKHEICAYRRNCCLTDYFACHKEGALF